MDAGVPAPVVSVVIPTYNRAHLVGRALGSVLGQSFRDLEALVVDDASADGTEAVVRRVGDPRVRYLRHEANRGAAAARNTGVRQARGRYVGFLDSDDQWLPHKLALQVPRLEADPGAALVYGGWQWLSGDGEVVERRRVPDARGRIVGLPRWAFNVAVDFLARADLLREVGYNEALRNYMECDLLLRLAARGRFTFVSEVVVSCYSHRGPRLSDMAALHKSRELDYLLREHGWRIRRDPAAWARFNLMLGGLYLRNLRVGGPARRHLWRVVRARPLSWRGWAYALGSLLPPAALRPARR